MQRISTRLRVWCFPYLRACMASKHQKGAFAVSVNRYERLNEEHRYHQVKKRVAAYCRVSTDHEDQANSFESQQRYFRQYIQYHPDWELYDIFADEGLSGTTTKKRREFNRMIACAENGEIDLIITKEISRFARNTLDSISYTRELKRHGVGVIFMSDNINTLDGDAELRLAIMSSIAQEESRKTSERVKWGQKRRMEQGIVFGRSMLGYDVKDGKMTINEDGAEVVRRIFHKFVNEGKGTHVICRELREEGIVPMRGKEWCNTVILRLLRNEKYCGDLVQKKTYTPDYLSHDKKYNKGQEEFVIIKDHHAPIISRELFDEANRILDERSDSQTGKSKHSNRYPFSGKIKCGCCGASYVSRYKQRQDGSRYKAWRCYEAVRNGPLHIDPSGNHVGCSGTGIRNEDAVHIMYLVTHSLQYDRKKVINHLLSVIQPVIHQDMSGVGIESSIYQIQREKQQERIRTITDAIDEIISGAAYEDVFYKHILNKMVVTDSEHIEVYLNLLPFTWTYAVSKMLPADTKVQRSISDASVPISVSSPFNSSKGME